MKKYLKMAGMGLALLLVVTLASLRIFGLEPSDLRPGLWVTGEGKVAASWIACLADNLDADIPTGSELVVQ